MVWNKIKICFFCIIGFVISAFLYLELQAMGFPDGFLSNLDKARKLYYPIFIATNFGFIVHSLLLTKKVRRKNFKKQINFCYGAYFLVMTLFYSGDRLLSLLLDNGIGG